ncbi:putative beta-N-acetylglucosaminidase [Halenospora varia]|nr:putative beta-N-acetylglucosaminidase [Halenospora varia]
MTETQTNTAPWSDEELRTKVGQLFIVGFHGHVPSEDIKTLITKHKVGTVILFQRNVHSDTQLLDLTNSLQDLARSAGHARDLFIGIDQENGLVTRIKSPIAAQLPGSMALGATKDAANAYRVAAATAETLKAFGVNFNYAPIADVNSEPKNPVIGVRSPSDDPEAVGRFVSAQVKGLSEGGIVPCVKHFPGHGDTAVDSHYGLPVITKSKAMVEECELVPFRRAVAEGVDAVMTAHIVMDNLCSEIMATEPGMVMNDDFKQLPASINPVAIGILRKQMHYKGLIVSDCLEMDGVRAPYGTEKAAVMALKAGTDCVMICHTMAAQVGAIEMVIQAVKTGELSQEAIQASVDRVHLLKDKYLSPNRKALPVSSLAKAEARNKTHSELAAGVYAKSTTVVRSTPGFFPISNDQQTKIVFVSPGKTLVGGGAVESGEEKTREPYTPATYIDLLRVHDPSIADVRFFDGIALTADEQKSLDAASLVIFATRNASLSAYQKEFGLDLGKKFGTRLIVIATCDPYDFLEVKEIRNYITIYEPTIPAFQSAVNVLFGVNKPTATLPVGISAPTPDIKEFTRTAADVDKIWYMWQEIFPKWKIERLRLEKLLYQETGHHLIHDKGFCISFLVEPSHGKLSVIGVLPNARGKGVGTALVRKARQQLRSAAISDGSPDLMGFGIGSVFPRFWPGVPIDLPQPTKDFFLHRGFRKSTAPTARDLYRDITQDVASTDVLDRVAKLPLTYAPWTAEMYDECLTKQRANFKNIGWIKAYERLAARNQHHEVMVAFDESGAQVGWTLMCSPAAIISNDFAFIPCMPSGQDTGLIACVGVDEKARGGGVGLALLVKAMENMRERGIKGVCIDWVVIRGFYERLGYQVCWEYEGYDW